MCVYRIAKQSSEKEGMESICNVFSMHFPHTSPEAQFDFYIILLHFIYVWFILHILILSYGNHHFWKKKRESHRKKSGYPDPVKITLLCLTIHVSSWGSWICELQRASPHDAGSFVLEIGALTLPAVSSAAVRRFSLDTGALYGCCSGLLAPSRVRLSVRMGSERTAREVARLVPVRSSSPPCARGPCKRTVSPLAGQHTDTCFVPLTVILDKSKHRVPQSAWTRQRKARGLLLFPGNLSKKWDATLAFKMGRIGSSVKDNFIYGISLDLSNFVQRK